MTHVRTLILGGGMSGLSCAYHLKQDYLVVEKSDEPGGLSRSIKQDGFVFDHTGHLLHLRHPYTLELIPKLLGDNLTLNRRRAWVYSHHTFTRYPYQANLYGLPKKVIQECLNGLVEAQLRRANPSPRASPALSPSVGERGTATFSPRPPQGGEGGGEGGPESLKSWVLRTFGKGFAKHFFFPYNEKLWTVSPGVLTAEWVAPFVPKPSVQEVITGAFSDQTKQFGYNASFYYPKEGGIQALAFAFARGLQNVRLNTEAESIDLEKKSVTLAHGETISYDFLVNTLPLARFLKMASALPAEVETVHRSLRWSSVYDINLGIKRPRISDKHWIYFPEKKYRFYRVGFPMNFSSHMTPPGCSSLYVEIAYFPGHRFDEARALKDAIRGLLDCGLLRNEEEIISRNLVRIPVAYVTYDKNRTRSTEFLLQYLASRQVYSIGRFGAWKYSYMEEAILEGKSTAERILAS